MRLGVSNSVDRYNKEIVDGIIVYYNPDLPDLYRKAIIMLEKIFFIKRLGVIGKNQ